MLKSARVTGLSALRVRLCIRLRICVKDLILTTTVCCCC